MTTIENLIGSAFGVQLRGVGNANVLAGLGADLLTERGGADRFALDATAPAKFQAATASSARLMMGR